jgi:hypothetical protein
MTLAEEFQQTWQASGSSELFLGHLKNLGLLDIGILEQIYTDNIHGLVQTFNDSLDKLDVELCLFSGLGQISVGQIGLILIPQQSVEVATHTKDITQPLYSRQYAKFIPLTSTVLLPVKLTNTPSGINLGSGKYSLTFGSDKIELISDDCTISLDVKTDELHVLCAKAADRLEFIANPTGLKTYLGDTTLDVSSKGVKIKGNITVEGDVTVTGNFSAGNGNFTVDK